MNTTNDDPQGRPERDVRRHWNYRIIEFVDPATNEPWRAIHEVHYSDGRPTSYSEAAATIVWDVTDGDGSAACQMEMMRAAFNKPVLVERDFGATPELGDVRLVRFMGIDPLKIGDGATQPMLRGSWRFAFTDDGSGVLRFHFNDHGPLVAVDAV